MSSLFRPSADMFSELNRLQGVLQQVLNPSGRSSIRALSGATFPMINVGTTPDAVEVMALAPGIDPNALQVSVDRGLLVIAGERRSSMPSGSGSQGSQAHGSNDTGQRSQAAGGQGQGSQSQGGQGQGGQSQGGQGQGGQGQGGHNQAGQGQGNNQVSIYSQERFTGTFRRVISLPEDADPGKVEASYRDGVLRISIAKRESSRPRRINVN